MPSESLTQIKQDGETYLIDRVAPGLALVSRKQAVPGRRILPILVNRHWKIALIATCSTILSVALGLLFGSGPGILFASVAVLMLTVFILVSIRPWRRIRAGGRSINEWRQFMVRHEALFDPTRAFRLYGPPPPQLPADVRTASDEAGLQGGVRKRYAQEMLNGSKDWSRRILRGVSESSFDAWMGSHFDTTSLLKDGSLGRGPFLSDGALVVDGFDDILFKFPGTEHSDEELCSLMPDMLALKRDIEARATFTRLHEEAVIEGASRDYPEMAQIRDDQAVVDERIREGRESVQERLDAMKLAREQRALEEAEQRALSRREDALRALQEARDEYFGK